MTTPNLPPLPIPGDSTIVQGFAPDDERLQAYALTAYQAGFNEALEQVKARIEAMQDRETE